MLYIARHFLVNGYKGVQNPSRDLKAYWYSWLNKSFRSGKYPIFPWWLSKLQRNIMQCSCIEKVYFYSNKVALVSRLKQPHINWFIFSLNVIQMIYLSLISLYPKCCCRCNVRPASREVFPFVAYASQQHSSYWWNQRYWYSQYQCPLYLCWDNGLWI